VPLVHNTGTNVLVKAIGRRLAQERRRLGQSQEAFAKIALMGVRTYRNYERGSRDAPVSLLTKLSAVGLDVGYVAVGTRTVADSTASGRGHILSPEAIRLLANFEECDERSRAALEAVAEVLPRGSVMQVMAAIAAIGEATMQRSSSRPRKRAKTAQEDAPVSQPHGQST
jgi:transcriptional regulator with XRE-family HTH domain